MKSVAMQIVVVVAMTATGCAPAPDAEPAPVGPTGRPRVPAPRHHPPTTDVELRLAAGHPRLVFRPADAPPGRDGRTFAEIRELYKSDATFKSIFEMQLAIPVDKQGAVSLAACFIATGDDKYAEAAAAKMTEQSLTKSDEQYYSNVWELALAYDWLFDHPALANGKREAVGERLLERLGSELDYLDRVGMALWHGRNQAANNAMIAALAVGDLPGGDRLLRRAAAHYIESLRALEFAEGWPEGASYWIYNRAGPYAMAADCVTTALGLEEIAGISIREVMRRIGLWQVYQFAPNGVFEPYGDSAGSIILGQTGWWTVTTDHFARVSRDPGLMAGADYIRNSSPVPYGRRPYYWMAVCTYDPAVRPSADYDPAKPELWMREHLPQTMLFGRGSMGVAFFRDKWGDPGELYATFKAGDLLAHHDHYDAGHFSIQCGGLLAPQTGLYGPGGYTGRHRLGYSIQTVSANSLLVLAPGESSAVLAGNSKAAWSALSGGQRVISPTSFNCVNLEHFRDQLGAGPHLERATFSAFESRPGDLDYAAADITAAYNSTRWAEPGSRPKVSLVTRQFLFLRRHGAFVVYDRVETTDPAFRPRWLLHHMARPETGGNDRLLAGADPDNGIVETAARLLTSKHGSGRLLHSVLLPAEARVFCIGGPDFCCYVESDGDAADGFDGENLWEGKHPGEKRGAQLGLWRTEVEPVGGGRSCRFLNVLLAGPADGGAAPEVRRIDVGGAADAALVGDTVCVFAREPKPLRKIAVEAPGARCVILDAVPGAVYALGGGRFTASSEGVLVVDRLPEGTAELETVQR